MRKASLAEFLLSLVAPRDQAASMTGDFLEQAERRGRAWFWYSVVRTSLAWSVRELVEHPKVFLYLALRGFLFLFLWQLPVLFFTFLLGASLWPSDRELWFPWTVAISALVSQFLVGRGVARRAPGRELSGWLSIAIPETVVNCALIAGSGLGFRAIPVACVCFTLYQIPALTGAVSIRRGSLGFA
jgi:hypothetical protein